MRAIEFFEINIVSALTEQLMDAFDRLGTEPLTASSIQRVKGAQGVYQLFLESERVYVGKTDNLAKRLKEHRRKIEGRQNIQARDVSFKCLYVHPNWTALAPEKALIGHYRTHGGCDWNGNGFGNHDPGREREETNKDPEGFDEQYPIRRDWDCSEIAPGSHEIHTLLQALKRTLPYLLRFQRLKKNSPAPHPDFKGVSIEVAAEDRLAADRLLKVIASRLPGWQATVFCSHMILYKESKDYQHGDRL